ncbi:MAG: ABC transporter permease [Firmicutes bacterium]|jgi:simple sugar transport system permease protein|nr:ABC transporter permease [Bacillota bacterium]MBR3183089.1 ABC transporter permease [Bacillota bacterium]MBR3260838.1 ABC transporter permease [Bacillota bacterium]MBR6225417.1 ABC transporter permease [Bacillota bacterium]MBR6955639.1 ABC transporter permease [Bacillota bacterium]
MSFNIIGLIKAAIINGTPLLFGTSGEILTEKSGNLNLGVEGLMFMGGAFGLMGAFLYGNAAGDSASGAVAVAIALLCSFGIGCIGSLIFSFLTITLRANQNVTGLALTIFGTGVGQFVGELMRIKVGGNVTISNALKAAFAEPILPAALQKIPVLGQILFSYNLFVYLGVIMALVMAWFMKKTRKGLFLAAVGESPATADAAGINVTRYRYLATVIGGGISAVGGMVYTMTIAGSVWNHSGLSGEGWVAVALVIFCLWRPINALWGSALFGALLILYLRLPIPFLPTQIYKIVPYIATALVLIMVSMRQRREDQPPQGLGLNYFREDR